MTFSRKGSTKRDPPVDRSTKSDSLVDSDLFYDAPAVPDIIDDANSAGSVADSVADNNEATVHSPKLTERQQVSNNPFHQNNPFLQNPFIDPPANINMTNNHAPLTLTTTSTSTPAYIRYTSASVDEIQNWEVTETFFNSAEPTETAPLVGGSTTPKSISIHSFKYDDHNDDELPEYARIIKKKFGYEPRPTRGPYKKKQNRKPDLPSQQQQQQLLFNSPNEFQNSKYFKDSKDPDQKQQHPFSTPQSDSTESPILREILHESKFSKLRNAKNGSISRIKRFFSSSS